MKLFVGRGFADVRKKQVVSKYHRVVAKEKKNLGAWNAKLEKIYAEDGRTADIDPLERFGTKKKKKKKNERKDDVNDSSEQTASHVAETVSETVSETVVDGDQALSQSSEPKPSTDKPSAAPDNSRYGRMCWKDFISGL